MIGGDGELICPRTNIVRTTRGNDCHLVQPTASATWRWVCNTSSVCRVYYTGVVTVVSVTTMHWPTYNTKTVFFLSSCPNLLLVRTISSWLIGPWLPTVHMMVLRSYGCSSHMSGGLPAFFFHCFSSEDNTVPLPRPGYRVFLMWRSSYGIHGYRPDRIHMGIRNTERWAKYTSAAQIIQTTKLKKRQADRPINGRMRDRHLKE